MKNWIKFSSALLMVLVLFTACQDDAEPEITVMPEDVTLQLGEEWDYMTGVSVENFELNDVVVSQAPTFNKHLVDHYAFTYAAGTATADRNVYVSSAALAGTYSVSDLEDGATSPFTYNLTVLQHVTDFNRLVIQGFAGFSNVTAEAVINGAFLMVNEFTPAAWSAGESISATGSYNGETKALVSLDIIIKELVGGEIVTTNSTATLTKIAN